MSSNFAFLQEHFPALAKLGQWAEEYCYRDANSCLMKLGMMGETIVNLIIQMDGVAVADGATAVDKIKALVYEDLLPADLADILHGLRKARNKAAHENYASEEEAKNLLQTAYGLCEWFMQVYGDYHYEHHDFVLPQPAAAPAVTAVSVVAKEREAAEEEKLVAATMAQAAAVPAVSKAERRNRAKQFANQRVLSEAETRMLIDEQLEQVGWEADTENLRYSKGTRPQKGHNMAIAEWPTDSSVGKQGFADYELFCGEQMVATVEAKAIHKDISSVIDYQCRDYSKNIRACDMKYVPQVYGEYKVPFTFATNGRPYVKQLDTKSGIWFRDLRQAANTPKALSGWISPMGMQEMLARDVQGANARLLATDYDLLQDEDGLHLRDYQIRAIKAAEQAIINGQQSVLLAMATGTGKTRTVLGMIYRFLKTNRFKRILFLVDRNSLGKQAQDVFKDVKLEDLQPLTNIYEVKELEDKTINAETRVHVATVQGMVKRLLYNAGESKPAVSDYDLIIIDEAHRGYILDKEMTDSESLFRDQSDFQSKYRSVIDYFNGVKIALTATPALHTTQIFGMPVFKYTYREAVIEGYLVDHDAPFMLQTKLSQEGITYKKGDKVNVYDPATGAVVPYELMDDELHIDVENFNKRVIVEGFNRAVLEEISAHIDPESKENGKTLIYAVNDQHADLIVKILKEIYSAKGMDTDAIMKITGSVGGGNQKKIEEAIKRFKNERYPSIVVTVDLLTTGIDVPEITKLVFMRRIKSRILFEQMLGRATRLCPAIHKTHFEIFDPVGVYEDLEPVSEMKPTVTDANVSLTKYIQDLEHIDDDAGIRGIVDAIVAKLQRKKRNLTPAKEERFKVLTDGLTIDDFIRQLLQDDAPKNKAKLLLCGELFKMLDEGKYPKGKAPILIDNQSDVVLNKGYGYGTDNNMQRPEDYLDEFAHFVKNNVNKIDALNIVCTRPKDLTRKQLQELCLALDDEGYTELKLNNALQHVTNEDMTADIISLIRRFAIGSTLLSHEDKVKKAVKRLLKAHDFNQIQKNWIARIEQYMLKESVLNMQTFDEAMAFKSKGGSKRLNLQFDGKLQDVVTELNTYLYDDGGRVA